MKFGKSKPAKKKKVKRSKKEREVLKATGGWGTKDAAYRDSDDEEQLIKRNDMGPTSAVAPGGWRRTQAADDKARRVVERKWLKEQQQRFEEEMRAPLFEAPVKEKKPKNRRRKASAIAALGDRMEDDVGPDGRRKVMCIRRKKPLSDSEDDDDDEEGENAFDNDDDDSALGGRLTAFQKLVKRSKAAAASASAKKGVSDEHDEEGSGGSDDEDEEEHGNAEGALPIATASTAPAPVATAPVSDAGDAAKLSRAAYDRHFRAQLTTAASSGTGTQVDAKGTTTSGHARLGAFSTVAGFAPAAVQKSFADNGDLERGNWLEVAAAKAAMGGPNSDAASLALQQAASASGAAGGAMAPPKLNALLHSAFDSFGDVLFAAPTPLPSTKKRRGGRRRPPGGTELVDVAQREALSHVCRLVLTARSRVLEHDAKLRKVELRAREAAAAAQARGQGKAAKAQAAAAAAAVKKAKSEAKAAAAAGKEGKSALPLLLQAEEDEEDGDASAADDDDDEEEAEGDDDDDDDEFGNAEQDDDNDGDWLRDQGFTRPRVLLLVPTRHVAWRLVSCLAALLGPNAQVRDRERFDQEFGPEEDDDDDDDEDEEMDEETAKKKQKPADWDALFAGNNDDSFKLGLQLTPSRFAKPPPKAKTGAVKAPEMKLFTDFYRSDIVVASPLGLVLAFNAAASDDRDNGDGEGADESALVGVEDDSDGEGGGGGAHDDDDDGAGAKGQRKARAAAKAAKKQKALSAASDFLSSIESCVVFDADASAQQNWNHVSRVFAELNHRPVLDRGSDYARVRNWLLDDDPKIAARYRQTVLLSRSLLPPLVNLFAAQGKSHAGALRLRGVQQKGAAARLAAPHAQLFQRIGPSAASGAASKAAGTSSSSSSLGAVDELRFAHLTNTVLAAAYRVHQRHTLLFVPDYLDFVRIRQWLSDQGHSFAAVHEYSRESEVGATIK